MAFFDTLFVRCIEMGCNKFSEEQMKQIKKNPYVIKVSESSITYSEEFKDEFIIRHNTGKLPKVILKELGFDITILGQKRINSITERCKKYALRDEGSKDIRKDNSNFGRPRTKDLTPEEEIAKLKHRNLVLEQENEFLKKMIFLAKKVQWEKSQQQKNIK